MLFKPSDRSTDTLSRKPMRLFLLALLMLSSIASMPTHAATRSDLDLAKEYQVKALFLYNFANFVEWPADAFADQSSTLKMCLYGAVPFGEFLDIVNGVMVRDRTLEVIRTTDYSRIQSGCHILFVGIEHHDQLDVFFKNLNHLFVLSIGNVKDFARKGGVVNILRTSDQQQFEINLSKAIENGLLISSDLLSLARIINDR
ncbi:YfiR family protein [Ketobacter sp.]|uniref:YfiR family protein n=1 Tax=Ketobacter sp. TaxID=2083498 RepID=UPI0025C0C5BC|nr:YfiR family protein [Ketobacter sp.]